MTYRAQDVGPTTFESAAGGCGLVGCMGTLIVPLWLMPLVILYSVFIEGDGFEGPFYVILPLVALGWLGLFWWASGAERFVFDGEGLRWETWRELGPVRTPKRVHRAAPWALVSAQLLRQLRTSKGGSPYEQVTLKLTLPDGTHDIAADSFKPWGSLLEALRQRLGDRYRETEDHGALGRAVERMVQSKLENASTRDDDVKMG